MAPFWQTNRFRIDLSRPRVMGIVNVTPDSFSDGGRHASARAAMLACERLVAEGADMLDIGGESSRPGAAAVTADEEMARVRPVLQEAVRLGVPVSIDTCKPDVMREALDLGVDIVNDIRALTAPGAVQILAGHMQAGVCLMHMRGDPATMQHRTSYDDAVREVADFLTQRVTVLRQAGVAPGRIVLDPGIGFGKTVGHNFELLSRQRELLALGYPLLVGWSRKSSLGAVTGRPVEQRMAASVAAALASIARGAHIVRVHDVAETVDAIKVWQAAATIPAGEEKSTP